MSSYIVNRHPQMYGGGQAYYLLQVQDIVEETAKEFKAAREEKRDLCALFNTTLTKFGEMRRKMAQNKGDEYAQQFGFFRNDPNIGGAGCFTDLVKPYDEYGRKALEFLQVQAKKLKYDPTSFRETEKKIPLSSCLGKTFSLEVSVITHEEAKSKLWDPTIGDLKVLCDICEVPNEKRPDFKLETVSFACLDESVSSMEKLKSKAPQLYQSYNLSRAVSSLKRNYSLKFERDILFKLFAGQSVVVYPPDKMDFLMFTLRGEINGKMYGLSKYLTWTHRDNQHDPVDFMTGRSVVKVIHQDLFLIKDTLQEVSKLFKAAMETSIEDLAAIQARVAIFLLFFDHCMPFLRGTAAISEWFEMSIYRCFGYGLEYNDRKLVNLEALTSMPSDFVKNYPSMIKLSKLDSVESDSSSNNNAPSSSKTK